MAALTSTMLNLADARKRVDPDDKMATIIEMLAQENAIYQDMPFLEGNLPTGHRTTVRTSLPSVGYRALNQGVARSKSTTRQVDFACGILEGRSAVDIELVNMQPNPAAFRLSEASAFMEAMAQKVALDVFYGNQDTDPKGFTGLAPWFANSSQDSWENVVSGGGSGSDNTSMWMVCWGDRTVHGVYPKNTIAGLEHTTKDNTTVYDSDNNPYDAHEDKFVQRVGLAVRDWRYVVCIPNIDVSALVANSSAANLIEKLITAYHKIPNMNGVKPVIYCNRTVSTALDLQARRDTNVHLMLREVQGEFVNSFRGIPIRTVDQLTDTEATVS